MRPSTTRRRTTTAGLAAAAALALLAACAEEPPPEVEVTVSGEPGEAPTLTYETPLVVEEARHELVWEGSGPKVEEGRPILLDFYAESGEDGSVINETYSSEPRPYLLSADVLGVDIFEALVGQRVGSRILHLVPPDATSGAATVAVFDLLPTRASGEEVEPREGLPTVTLGDHGEPSVAVPEGDPPADLVVQPLIRGAGEQIAAGQVVTVQYVGVTWSDGTVFDSTWTEGKLPASFPIGVGSVMAGWDQGLVEQTVGSQVLLVVPPELGYGGDDELSAETLVFVVDILHVSGDPVSVAQP
ncbi:MAG: FKBP-type peptidyl-prolyl cis-trans isomerase [Actinomycetales bacterium]|nr:FKBP-type peptidyl-prolyl cis-trans isomerase [Actinomycetales bacterium]